MLCKVSNDYLFPEPNIDAGDLFTTSSGITARNYGQVANITTPGGGKKYKYSCNIQFYNNAFNVSPYSSFWAEIDGGSKQLIYQLPGQSTGNYNITLNFEAMTRAVIYSYNPMSNSSMTTRIDAQTNKYSVGIPPKDGINGKPRELKEIGNKARTTIFGIHIDNTRVTQD